MQCFIVGIVDNLPDFNPIGVARTCHQRLEFISSEKERWTEIDSLRKGL